MQKQPVKMNKYVLSSLLLAVLALVNLPGYTYEDDFYEPAVIEHKQTLSVYIEKFCRDKGRPYVKVQNNIVIDCLASDSLWKVDYADNWPNALVQAMAYAIYDDYRGDEQYAPHPGIVLVQEDADDYRNMVQLKQLVAHYKLPIRLDVIENYSNTNQSLNSPTSKIIKNLQFDFFGNKKNVIELK